MSSAPGNSQRRQANAPSLDGRAARRDRGREAVLDAVIALFEEGHVRPTPEAVAERSGVSVRSVYRYYEDRDDLIRADTHRLVATTLRALLPSATPPLPDHPPAS